MKMKHQLGWMAALCVFAFLGCGGSDDPAATDGARATHGTDVTEEGPKKVPKSQLVVVTYGFRALDDGRIEVGTPSGWEFRPREKDYVIWFTKTGGGLIPQIIVTAADANGDFGDTLTEDKVVEFAAAIEKQLADEGKTLGKGLVEPVRPMIIGDRPCARYVTRAKVKLAPTDIPTVEIQVLVTILNGRKYTVELRVRDEDDPPDGMADELKAERDAAYAVLAGIRPHEAGSAKDSNESS